MSDDIYAAKRAIQEAYAAMVDSDVEDLVDAVFRGEIEDGDGLERRFNEDVGQRLTHDEEKIALFASDSIAEAASEAEDMGGFGSDPLALLASLAFRADVRQGLNELELTLDRRHERMDWIREVIAGEHGTEASMLWDKYLQKGGPLPEELEAVEPEEGEEGALPDDEVDSPSFRPTASELEDLPTISTGQSADLKLDTGATRVWLERVGVDDGAPYDNGVVIEKYRGGRWVTVREYDGGAR